MDQLEQLQLLTAYRKPTVNGATWNKSSQKWVAQIQVDGKNKCLGRFDTEEEAQAAYMKAGGRERIKKRLAIYETLMAEIKSFEAANPSSRCIPVGNKKFSTVDPENFEYLCQFKWKYRSHLGREYACRRIYVDGKETYIQMHREIMQAPDHLEVDHVKGSGLDNRKSNLRMATHQQNMCNRDDARNITGIKGVSWDERRKKWYSQIRSHGKQHYLGTFDTAEEVFEAYKKAADKLHGEFAKY